MSFYSKISEIFGISYYLVRIYTPFLFTPTTAAKPIVNDMEKFVLSYLIKVRSMGTATYIGIGDKYSQNFRLTSKGEVFGWNGNNREIFDFAKIYVISDTSDAVLEIFYLYKEGEEGKDNGPTLF